MLSKAIAICAIVTLLAGCTTMPATGLHPQSLSQQYTQFDVKMAWEVKAAPSTTIIEGVAQNLRYSTMEGLEIWVSALDPTGRTLGRAADITLPRRLDRNDSTSFRVVLPVAVPPGTTLLFTYTYLGFDGGGDEGGVAWMQSFERAVAKAGEYPK